MWGKEAGHGVQGPRLISELVTKEYLDVRLSELTFEMMKWIIGSVGAATITLLVAIVRFGRL